MNDTNSSAIPAPSTVRLLRGKLGATYFSFTLVAAALWPIQENWKDTPHDDFPLTYYPMFSAERDAVETFYYVVGRDQQGRRHTIHHKIIGTGGLNQVRRQLNRQVREGQAAKVAEAVAATLAGKTSTPWSDIVSVDVCRGKYSVDAWFHGGKLPVLEQVKATCAVTRTTP